MGRDHSCETCGRGGFNNDLDCICDDFVPRADLAKAEAERDEALLEAARWEGSFTGMVAVERELKASLAKTIEGLREMLGAPAQMEPRAARIAVSILVEIEGKGD